MAALQSVFWRAVDTRSRSAWCLAESASTMYQLLFTVARDDDVTRVNIGH